MQRMCGIIKDTVCVLTNMLLVCEELTYSLCVDGGCV